MNILLLGYGNMGQIIEHIALDRNHSISAKITSKNSEELKLINTDQVDVAIEFSQPEAAVNNIMFCLKNNIPVLSGTTGWLQKRSEVESYCKQKNGTFFYASNFSVGVNIFFRLNEQLANMMAHFNEYEAKIDEIHHTRKKDAPSGTAITLAEGLIKNIKKYKDWKLDDKLEGSLPVYAFREDDVPGTHTIEYSSSIDSIEIKHTAHSREGFAKGAVLVAEWLQGKKGVLSMNDYLKF